MEGSIAGHCHRFLGLTSITSITRITCITLSSHRLPHNRTRGAAVVSAVVREH
jgi:hypothetical protein